MAKVAYYIFIRPLSFLPLVILYLFTDFLFLLLILFIPYRKTVIDRNIANSFPELSENERKTLRRKFYRHFTNLLAESVKSLTFNPSFIKNHIQVKNPEVLSKLYDQKKNVILVSGHYNNWEWIVNGMPVLFKHKAIGIGMPLSSKFWDKKLNERRSRFGMTVAHSKNYKEVLKENQSNCHAVLVLADQSPGDSLKSYWTTFLNQQTAVAFGAELMAHQLNYAVVFYSMRKIKRGYFEIELTEITNDPSKNEWGYITESHVQLLEKEIIRKPENWLWSHKRWKRDIPQNLQEVMLHQKTKFNAKFKS